MASPAQSLRKGAVLVRWVRAPSTAVPTNEVETAWYLRTLSPLRSYIASLPPCSWSKRHKTAQIHEQGSRLLLSVEKMSKNVGAYF